VRHPSELDPFLVASIFAIQQRLPGKAMTIQTKDLDAARHHIDTDAHLLRSGDLKSRAEAVAAIAADHAVAVDRDARFPVESIAALREQRLLGIMVPRELGGEGATVSEAVDICFRLGRVCSSTAMIFAMHQIKVACVNRHRQSNAWHHRFLQRLCREQLLLASSTTEGQAGGNLRVSTAPIASEGSRIGLERQGTVISYGAYADGIVTTARRSADADPSDQVLVVFLKEDYSLEPILKWDTLGMRGTCSAGFTLLATGEGDQVLPDPYSKIHPQTMAPVAHLAWAGVWAGIAAGAVERTQSFVRHAARQAKGQLPPGAAHFTKANASLRVLHDLIGSSLRRFELAAGDERVLASLDFQTMVNLTKVDASELAVSVVMSALRASGLSGYRNDNEFSLGRSLRDVLSSPLMISNDRILSNIAATSLMSPVPASLLD
jgi:acyl-CoA dehydrogenase